MTDSGPSDRPGRQSGAANLNLPNLITALRIALAPVVFWLVLTSSPLDIVGRCFAASLFLVAVATDGIDGAIARRRGLVTALGTLLDPIADKVIISGTLVCLSAMGELPWLITAIIATRELGITGWRIVRLRRGQVVPASAGGKLKTLLQTVAVICVLIPAEGLLAPFGRGVTQGFQLGSVVTMSLAVMLTVWSGVAYLVAARKVRS